MTRVASDPRPLIMHIVHAFDVGGLENGVVNLINHMPQQSYRHAIVALTQVASFSERVRANDVEFVALDKRPGHGAWIYPTMYRLMRQMRPTIVHTRNLAALEMTIPAWLARVPLRIHSEHGRDIGDLDGSNRRHQWLRRAYKPFVSQYVALSRDLQRYLVDRIGIAPSRVAQIYNGVDTERFVPSEQRAAIADSPFNDSRLFVFGSVGRMAPVKNPLLLARAFVMLRALHPSSAHSRLIMIGEGPLREAAAEVLCGAGLEHEAWIPGARDDIPAILRGIDCFVLPSLAEGISNTILEAMATGLPVIATKVGGNLELIRDGATGRLVESANPAALAAAMLDVVQDPARARLAGAAARKRTIAEFSLDGMVQRYRAIYDTSIRSTGFQTGRSPSSSPMNGRY